MFKWPNPPSPGAPVHELADFAELLCWERTSTSMAAVEKVLSRLDENDYSEGVPEDESISILIQETFQELERRKDACNDFYPFRIDESGSVLNIVQATESEQIVIYKYLLLLTRLNMGTSRNGNRIYAQFDGTKLFEELSAETCRGYLGSRAESLVFGTGAENGSFPSKIAILCEKLQEGGGYRSNPEGRGHTRDGKLDIVAWKHFSDRRQGKLIAFGQCKTGTNYRDTLSELQPDSFCRKWLQESLVLPPIRAFFVAEALGRAEWFEAASDAGLLFDRCRILDFSNEVSEHVFNKVNMWTSAAAEAVGLPAD